MFGCRQTGAKYPAANGEAAAANSEPASAATATALPTRSPLARNARRPRPSRAWVVVCGGHIAGAEYRSAAWSATVQPQN